MLFNLIATLFLFGFGVCKPPNIFFILVDDLGYAEVGFNREQQDSEVTTPNIDQLAINEGLILQRHYVHYVKLLYYLFILYVHIIYICIAFI